MNAYSFFAQKKNSLSHKVLSFVVLVAMIVSLLPTMAAPAYAASDDDYGIMPLSIETGEEVTASFEVIKEPVIFSNKCNKTNKPNGVGSYQMSTTDNDGETGKGWCGDHKKGAPNGPTKFSVDNDTSMFTDATANVIFNGYGDGRDTSHYVETLYERILANAQQYGVPESWIGNWKDIVAGNEGFWKKATQLAVWMTLKQPDGKRMMAIEGQKEVSNGASTDPAVVGSASAGDYILLADNTNANAKACIECARALYFYATALADEGYSYADRKAAMMTKPIDTGNPDLSRYWDGTTLTLNSASPDGKGSVIEAGFKTEQIGGESYYVIPWIVNSATQVNEAGYTLKLSGDFPEGTIIKGMTTDQLSALGISTDVPSGIDYFNPAQPDKSGTEVTYFNCTPTTSGEGRTDADFGIPVGEGKQCFPGYFNILIPVKSCETKMPISLRVDASAEVYNYEMFVASSSNDKWQPFIVTNLYAKKSTSANILGGGKDDPPPPPPGTPQEEIPKEDIPSDSVIFKVDTEGNGVGGAQIRLTNTQTGKQYENVTLSTGKLPLQWTNPNGANYCEPGTYTVQEIAPPQGFNLDSDRTTVRTITLNADGSASGVITFVNSKKPFLTITKISGETGEGLAGAVFEIYKDAQMVGSVTTGTDGTVEFNEEGEGLSNGTYRIKEVTPPPGYVLPPEDQREQEIEVNIDNENPSLPVGIVTFTDYEYPSIEIQKIDAASNEPLDGATFDVLIDGQKVGSFTSQGGKVTLNYEQYGQYLAPEKDSWTLTVTETSAPDGYIINDPATQTQEIRKGQTLSPMVFKDTKIGEFVLKKTDQDGKPLAGAEFEIKIDGTNFSASKQTDGNGEIHVSYEEYGDYIDRNLNRWTFTVTEITPPEGYLLPNGNNVWTQEMLAGQTTSPLEIKNYKYPEIVVEKRDRESDQLLPGT